MDEVLQGRGQHRQLVKTEALFLPEPLFSFRGLSALRSIGCSTHGLGLKIKGVRCRAFMLRGVEGMPHFERGTVQTTIRLPMSYYPWSPGSSYDTAAQGPRPRMGPSSGLRRARGQKTARAPPVLPRWSCFSSPQFGSVRQRSHKHTHPSMMSPRPLGSCETIHVGLM